MASSQRVIIIGFLALLVLGVGLAAYLLVTQQRNINQQRSSTEATAQAQAAIATDQAMAAATQTEITAAQAASATTQAGTATAQAANATTQAEIAAAQAASATPQAGTATAQAVTAMLQSKTATAQAATATPQAQIAAAQAAKATLQAENAAAQIVTATVQAAAATSQAATATTQVGAATVQAAKSTSQAAAVEALAATVTAQVATITVEKAAIATVQAAIATAQAATATAQAATATAQAATATAQAEEARKVRQFISSIGPLPTIQATAVYYSARTAPDRTDYVTGARLTCVARDYNISNHFSDVIAMKSNAAALWPGAVVQTKSLRDGSLTQVNSRRMPGTIQIDLPVSPKESVVEEPSQASIAKALEGLLPLQSTAPNASIEFKAESAVSLAHAGLQLGIMPAFFENQAGARVGAGAATSQSQSHVVVQFYQRYYTVTFTPRDQTSFFRNAKVENLKNQMGDGNPPAYISSVEYGRMLIVMFNSASSQQDLEAAVQFKIGQKKPVEAGAQARWNRILGQATIQIIAEGGSAKDAAQVLTADDFERRLKEYIEQGVNVSRSAPGVPLRFRVNYLTDNTVVSIGDMVSGTTEDCTPHPLPDSQFMVTLREIRFSRDNWLLDFPAGIDICFNSWIDIQQKIPIGEACHVHFIDDQQPKRFDYKSRPFSVPSYNGSCFDINANFEQAIVLPVIGVVTKHQIGTKRMSICYRDGQWIPPIEPMLVNYQGIKLTVIFDLKLFSSPQSSPQALVEEISVMF